jgi:predicted esterase
MIHKYIIGKAGKTLLALHGTGGSEFDLIPLAKGIAPDYSILSVRGKVSENGMNRFFRRLSPGVFDMEDLVLRTNELADFVESAARDYDLGKIYALGYSNGANIAASMLLLRPKTLEGGILLRALMPIMPKEPPDLRGKRIYISAGRKDEMVSADESRKLAEVLADAGADVTLNFENSGHRIAEGEIQRIRNWVKKLK